MSSVVQFETINGMLSALLERYADATRPVLMWKSSGEYRSISYRDFGEWIERVAFGFVSIGIRPGDRVAVISENRPEWVIADMALLKIGGVNVSLYPSLTPKQIEFILNDSGACCVICSNALQLGKIRKVRESIPAVRTLVCFTCATGNDDDPLSFSDLANRGDELRRTDPDAVAMRSRDIRPDDLMTLIYTSGTTGNPKGVMLSHGNLVSNILSSTDCIPFIENDLLLSFLPLCHSYERMAGYYSALSCGVTIAYAESIDTVRENLLEVRPTIVTTVPRLFERIYGGLMKQSKSLPPLRKFIFRQSMSVRESYTRRRKAGRSGPLLRAAFSLADFLVFRKIRERLGGRIRFLVSGGAALSGELGEFFESIGVPILEGYGMTESSPVISVNRPDRKKFGTVGIPIPGVKVVIGEDGEILVKGPNVMMGYWNDPDGTREMVNADGWLHTGDIGMFDPEGYLVITDRKKHIIVSSGGKNIAPGPIENAFLRSTYINQVLVVGDGRLHLSALVVPDYDLLREYVSSSGGIPGSVDELVVHPEARTLIGNEIKQLQQDFATFERVRKFTLMPRPFSLEEGEVTPTLKIRRSVVEKKFKDVIDGMYA